MRALRRAPRGTLTSSREPRTPRCVLALPGRVVGGEVAQADLLELGRAVERRRDRRRAGRARRRSTVEDRVALLLRAAVGHREDASRASRRRSGARSSGRSRGPRPSARRSSGSSLGSTLQTPIPLAEKPARRWKRIAATRRRILRSIIPSRWARNSSVVDPDLGRGRVVGAVDDLHRALQRADHGDVGLVVGLRARARAAATASTVAASASVPLSISRFMLILNRVSVGSWRIDSAPVSSLEHLERALEAELGVGRGGDREPEVELVGAQVVVGDAGMGVDDLGRPVRVLGVDLGGDEHRGVAERAGVEDRRDLADDPAVEQALGPRLEFVDRQLRLRGEPLVGLGGRAGSSTASGSSAGDPCRRAGSRRRPCASAASVRRALGAAPNRPG